MTLDLVRTAVTVLGLMAATPDPAHLAEVMAWRKGREARLLADDGWLTVAGLFWLAPGKNVFGSDAHHPVTLPKGSPADAGVFLVTGKVVTFEISPGVTATVAGKPVTRGTLQSDAEGEQEPDVLALGRLRLFVIERGGKLAIRLRDLDSPQRRDWKGLSYFPVDTALRVTARFIPHAQPTTIAFPTIIGSIDNMRSPGTAIFTIAGRELRLDAALETGDLTRMFFIFKDSTAGADTYGAGRFLYSALAHDGKVVLDFNRAYTPPCAFTSFAVCPLPPKQNRLPVRIEAGERFYSGH